jgi:hypothetical protein
MDQFQRRPILWIFGAVVTLHIALSPIALAQSSNLPPPAGKVGELRRGPDGRLILVQPDSVPSPAPAPPRETTQSPAPSADPKPKPAASAAPPKSAEPARRQMAPCAPKAVTCVEVEGDASKSQKDVPITFGQPFAPGDIPAGATIIAEDEAGKALPLQIDQPATFPDGSLRFAVLSTIVPEISGGSRRTINLLRSNGPTKNARGDDPSTLLATGYDLSVEVVAYQPQVTRIQFGDRRTPFVLGESVTISLGDGPPERFTTQITKDTASADFQASTRLAIAFMEQINRSKSFRAYKLGEGGGFETLWVTRRDPPGKAFTVHIESTGRAPISVVNLAEHVPERRYVASMRRLLEQARKQPATWLDGPVATEFSLTSPLLDQETGKAHHLLSVRMDVRVYAGARQIRTDLVLENDWTFEKGQSNQSYSINVLQDGKSAFTKTALNHYHHARWHKIFWRNEPTVQLTYDIAYFIKSRAVWNYDRTIRIAESILSDFQRRLTSADNGPMGQGLLTLYMPTTGARPDIGPLPQWSAIFLLSQDPRAKSVVLATGDVSGSTPTHYRDESTDQPVRIDGHPTGVIPMYGHLEGNEILPHPKNGDTPWTIDSAHQPSLAYLPYLISGDKYYLDEVMFWANFNMLIVPPGARQQSKGLLFYNQIRAIAWSLRSLGEAARILADRHPMKSYFVARLNDNLRWFLDHYVHNTDREVSSSLGWIERFDQPTGTAPWQIDYLVLIVGQIAEGGDAMATELFRWLTRFTVGRWIHQAQGYCRAMAPSAALAIRTKEGRAIQDWATLFKENFRDVTECPSPTAFPEHSYPATSFGYVAISRAMLAMAADFKVEGALEAYQRLRADTPSATAGMSVDPSVAIIPRN